MFPWLWIFAPQTYWPLSGAVTQDVSLDAFFRGIKPGAGVAGIEQRVFERASYGKQLGWLTDVLVDAIDPGALPSPEAREALGKLKALRADVERIKGDVRRARTEAAAALLDSMAADSPEELDRLLRRYAGGGQPPR